MSQGGGLDGQLGRTDGGTGCGGRGPAKPAAAGGGGPQGQALRRLVRRRESEPTDNVVKPVRCRLANVARGSGSADLEHVADLPLAARCGLAASFCTFDLPLADVREDGAEVVVLDDRSLRNLTQLVKGCVRQIEPTITDRQPTVGIIDDGDALAAEFASELVWLDQEHDLVVLQGQVIGDRALLAPGEDVGRIVVNR